MVIENVVICVDNSEYARNEDFFPSRLKAQCEAADFIVQTTLTTHPENHVGVVTLSNNKVVNNLTTNETKLLTQIHKITLGSHTRFLQGLALAQLMLKHRPIKTHKCRIIVFLGSPVQLSEIEAVTLGKKLKKCNISLDILKFGDDGDETDCLNRIVDTMNRNSLSENKLVKTPAGVNICVSLVSSGILRNMRNPGTSRRSQEDEDLRMALELSLRQAGCAAAESQGTTAVDGNRNTLTEEEQFEMAIQLSLQEASNNREGGNENLNPNEHQSLIESNGNAQTSNVNHGCQQQKNESTNCENDPNQGHHSSTQSQKRKNNGSNDRNEPDSKKRKPSAE